MFLFQPSLSFQQDIVSSVKFKILSLNSLLKIPLLSMLSKTWLIFGLNKNANETKLKETVERKWRILEPT